MKIAALILFGLFVFARSHVVGKNTRDLRVVNGEDAKIGEFPFDVSLQESNHFCGGSIVNEYWVVTAAHCLKSRQNTQVRVVVGTVNLEEKYSSHFSSQIIIHEDYARELYRNDIALLKVIVPFKFSSRVQPVALPQPHIDIKVNTSAVVSGWGTKYTSGISKVLQKAEIFIADQKYCREIMKERYRTIYPTNICANDPSTRRGQCNGDSGGPLIVDGKLAGIVSWSVKDPSCASTRYPGVYTRVSEYVDWIRENTK